LIILQQKPETTIAEISALLGITDRAVKKNLTTLKKAGAIKRIGPDKGGRWEVVE
jgi:ATP-dependent DNA helicase RecG